MNISTKTAGALALVSGLLATTSAFAQIAATATTDLNIRSGPGPQYEVVGTIAASDSANVDGCLQDSKWCQVTYNGVTGWSYSEYLAGTFGGEQQVVITQAPSTVQVPVVQYEQPQTNATVGAASGAVVGALVAGPVGAAAGGLVGAAAGLASAPPATVDTYVVDHSMDPVYLDGEVVVGAGVPDTVTLQPVPDYQYEYVYINGQRVLVDPQTRQIVYVYR